MKAPTSVSYRVSSFSPWKTRISAPSWPSATVEKISVREAGSGVLRSMIGAKWWTDGTPLSVAQGLDAERVRGDVDEHRADVDARDQAALDGRPHRHGQVGLDLGVDRPAEPLLQQAVDQRRPRRAADQDHLVDLVRLEPGVVERLVDAGQRLHQQRLDQRLVLPAIDLQSSGAAGRRPSRR